MAEIPDDIMERARETVTPFLRQEGKIYGPELERAIATALLAERAAQREKDAGIAEKGVQQECCGNYQWDGDPATFPECCGSPNIVPMHAKEIAAAIRNQS